MEISQTVFLSAFLASSTEHTHPYRVDQLKTHRCLINEHTQRAIGHSWSSPSRPLLVWLFFFVCLWVKRPLKIGSRGHFLEQCIADRCQAGTREETGESERKMDRWTGRDRKKDREWIEGGVPGLKSIQVASGGWRGKGQRLSQ